ncbi:FHA domain-containing protein [Chitinimonas sp.]|uniref:FHA domain-containing protein n=1 Tax=Chitinimonas sp. TaxID=1934313 RepID=UPI0035B44E54
MTTKIILSLDGNVLREVVLDHEKLTIGRKAHNHLQIDNLAVSGEHAVITTIQNDSFLEDLQSTNGTMVNGQPVQKHFLQDGDVVEIGKYKLKYVREGAAKGHPQEDFERTMVIRPGAKPAPKPEPAFKPGDTHTSIDAPTVQAPLLQQTEAPAAEARAAAIQVLNGANAGKSLELTKNLTSLGKPGVQVAIITRRPNGYFLTHVEGPSRPLVNSEQIGVQAHELHDHDVIELAGIKMEFFYK